MSGVFVLLEQVDRATIEQTHFTFAAQLSKVRAKVESGLNYVTFVALQHPRVQILPHVHRGGHHTCTFVDVESLSRIAAGLNAAALFPRVILWK